MDAALKRKNILDLHFQKYLVIASTSIVVMFTYFIGISIAILTKQINLRDFPTMLALFIISGGILGICFLIFFNASFHLRNIPSIVNNL